MQRSKSAGNRKSLPKQPDRRNTTPDYVNINKTPSDNDDVFYVNVGLRKNKEPARKAAGKSAFQFEKYDDNVASNYYEVGATSPYEDVNGSHSPYMNLFRRSNTTNGRTSYENEDNVMLSPPPSAGKSKLNYVELNLSKYPSLGSPNSRTSSSGSSVLNSPVSLSPTKQASGDYVRIDPNATGAINRSISEHRQQEGKRRSKLQKAST